MRDEQPMPDTTAADGTVYTAEDFTELFNDIGLAAMIPIALGQSVFSVISLLIQAAAIHGAATMILKGDGTLVYLLRRVVPFQTVVIMGYAGLFIVMSLLGGSESVLSLYGLVSFIGSLVVIFFLSSIVGQVYNFGAASGCGAILLGGILLVVLFFCGYCGLISVLGTLLSGAS